MVASHIGPSVSCFSLLQRHRVSYDAAVARSTSLRCPRLSSWRTGLSPRYRPDQSVDPSVQHACGTKTVPNITVLTVISAEARIGRVSKSEATCHGEDATNDSACPDQEVKKVPGVPYGDVNWRQVKDEEYRRHLHPAFRDATPVLCDAELVGVNPPTCRANAR